MPRTHQPGLVNYWGYSPVSFFAPHTAYSSQPGVQAAIDEFRDMVKALHRAGIEVILDVVYNHTAEGDHTGPTFCFRGLDNEVYYILDPDNDGDRSRYANYSGTGNTLNANQSTVRRMIIDSLHYWVQEMHVDGFRFDLASILSRDEKGHPLANPPVLWDIENDPILAGTKLIAEAWDAAGLYQVGNFIGDRWKEWNGHFRDDVRSFVKSDPNMVQAIAPRLFGSPDLYGLSEQEADQSINFVTCHDGFTLNDLVSYDEKHNWANGEQNRDGNNDNRSWNCGAEGPTDDPAVEQLRRRQIKNFLAFTLLSLGVPMLLMGDEVRRTQGGNNNAYCQDNEVSWFDWSQLEKHAGIHLFVRRLIRFRLELYIFKEIHGLSLTELLRLARIEWHGTRLNTPDNGDDSRTLALLVAGTREAIYVICNAFWEPLDFELPHAPFAVAGWRRILDTSLESPDDFQELATAPLVIGPTYRAAAALVRPAGGRDTVRGKSVICRHCVLAAVSLMSAVSFHLDYNEITCTCDRRLEVYVNNLFVWIWAALALIFFIAEIFTAGFFLVCFGIGAVAAAILAVLNFHVIWQLVAFIVVSLVALAFLRPMAMRMATHVANPGGIDRVIGKQAVVLEEINPLAATGRVRIEREEWRADSYGPVIPKDAVVVVLEVAGTRVMVRGSSHS